MGRVQRGGRLQLGLVELQWRRGTLPCERLESTWRDKEKVVCARASGEGDERGVWYYSSHVEQKIKSIDPIFF